jgi:endonuclease-3
LLQRLQATRGELSLEFLHTAPLPEAVSYLKQMRGIGPKTIACTLLFAAKRDIFPLDTHIFRILRRAALLPAKYSDAQAHALMDRLIQPGKFYSLHINLIRLGRAVCHPQNPRCPRCPIVEYCEHGQSVI